MNPRFSPYDIQQLAQRYWNFAKGVQRDREKDIIQHRAPAFRERGYLTREDLITLVKWKSPRTVPKVEKNGEALVQEVTALSLSQGSSEELRIKILTLLYGAQWPVASVILHFAFPDRYPILDFRAIESLQDQPKTYTFDFWSRYTQFCQAYIAQHGITMRDFDRALWTYSKES